MTQAKALGSYQSMAVTSASPAKLVLMLFDGALRFLTRAREGFEIEEFAQRMETIHNNLIRVQQILAELQRSLDLHNGGEFATTMFRLYDYMNEQLNEANVRKDSAPLQIVEKILREIRDAWEEMLSQQPAAPSDACLETSSGGLSLSA